MRKNYAYMIASIDDKRNIFLFNQETRYLF